jgi:hypothetical protein
MALIARPEAVAPHKIVVLDADGYGLRVPKSVGRRMTPGARIVIMQRRELIEEQQPPEIRQLWIYRTAEPGWETRAGRAGKTCIAQRRRHAAFKVVSPASADHQDSHQHVTKWKHGSHNDSVLPSDRVAAERQSMLIDNAHGGNERTQ